MNKAAYSFENIDEENYFYSFVSTGKMGTIQKIVVFQEMSLLLYNVALLDYNKNTGDLSDETISNNQDLSMIFATIFKIIEDFLQNNTHFSVYIQANSETKNKLYNRIIKNNLKDLQTKYIILGVRENKEIEYYLPNNTENYTAFVVRMMEKQN